MQILFCGKPYCWYDEFSEIIFLSFSAFDSSLVELIRTSELNGSPGFIRSTAK